MAYTCDLCGKGLMFGQSIARRGRAKKQGGVGRKITGVTKRVFKPNLQKVRVVVDGTSKRMRVCTQCIRSGKINKVAWSKLDQEMSKMVKPILCKDGLFLCSDGRWCYRPISRPNALRWIGFGVSAEPPLRIGYAPRISRIVEPKSVGTRDELRSMG